MVSYRPVGQSLWSSESSVHCTSSEELSVSVCDVTLSVKQAAYKGLAFVVSACELCSALLSCAPEEVMCLLEPQLASLLNGDDY